MITTKVKWLIDTITPPRLFKRLSSALSSALIALILVSCSGSDSPSPSENPNPLDVNDQPPVMTSPSVATVLENTQVVLTLRATDPDNIPGQPQNFNLAGTDASLFDITGNALRFKTAPDYEQRVCGGDNLCIVTITPDDGVNRGLAQTISITVMDATEAVPVTPQPAYAGVPEHSTHVLSITVTDEDDINTQDLAFTITGSDARLFTIERNVLSFRVAPDFEDPRCRAVVSNPNQCKIEITPSDGVNTGAPQQVTVSVINLNDIQPFMSSTDTVTLAENIGTVLTLSVTDADNLADQTHSFSLSGLNADLFSVSGSTLSFVSAPNYERFICGGDNLCDLSVTPFDGINRGNTQAIQVRVTNSNDIAPVMTSRSTILINENSTAVLTLTASDADNLAGQTQGFALSGEHASLFTIDNGNQLRFIDAPDFEAEVCSANRCNIAITPTDGTNIGATQAVSVFIRNIDDIAPIMSSTTAVTINENSTAVLNLRATDADQLLGQTQSFHLSAGDTALFAIDGRQLRFIDAPDYENDSCGVDHQCVVSVFPSDGTNVGLPQTITISIANLDDTAPIMSSSNRASVPENTTPVLTLNASDADNLVGQIQSFSLGGSDASLFSIINDNELVFNSAPDYESFICGTNSQCELRITPTDGTNSGAVQRLRVTIVNANDIAPVMSSASLVMVPENTTATVLLLTATDADNIAGQTQGFSLLPPSSVNTNDLFRIDGNRLLFIDPPDYETIATTSNCLDLGIRLKCDIQVTANDGINTSALAALIEVRLTNLDDTAPVMSSANSVNAPENSTATFLTLTATDADNISGQTQSFSLGGSDASLFSIDGNALSFTSANDYENDSCGVDHQCSISVSATDGSNNRGAAQTITINVTNVNDVAPVMSSSATVDVFENKVTALVLTASDGDGQTQGFNFALNGGNSALFTVNGANLNFIDPPDFENPACGGTNQCQVTITPDDGVNTGVAQTIAITIVNIILEDPPVMTSASATTVVENTTATVLLLTATDPDETSTTAVISYAIIGTDANLFMVDGSSLNFLVAPDFETPMCGSSNDQNVCQIAVIPTDRFFNSGIAQTITITIDNLNDNTPVLAITVTYTIPEDLLRAIEVGTITDADDPDGTGDYPFILAGRDAALFEITTTSSMPAINNANGFDYENPTCAGGTSNSCQLTITPFDGTNYGITQNFTVIVNNDNDEAPVMISRNSVTVDENSADTTIGLNARDADNLPGQVITFTLGGTDASIFEIGASDGLMFINPPDFETPACNGDTSNVCVITVTPSDGTNDGDPQTITITIRDLVFQLTAADSTVFEGYSGVTTTHNVSLTLDTGTASIDYVIRDGSATRASLDYATAGGGTSGRLNFNGGGTQNIVLFIIGDVEFETHETLEIGLLNANNIDVTTSTIQVTILNDEIRLNDTGITFSGNETDNNTGCSGNSLIFLSEQDCAKGRDSEAQANSLTKVGAGVAGFDFTKLAADGSDLAIQTATYSVTGTEAAGTIWSCVRDNYTGFIWEVKTDDGSAYDKDMTYRWGGLTAVGRDHPDSRGTYYDDWNGLVNTANGVATGSDANGLCGFTDWRVPKLEELRSLVIFETSSSGDDNFFPYNSSTFGYWSASPDSDDNADAWRINSVGADQVTVRLTPSSLRVRLVRSDH